MKLNKIKIIIFSLVAYIALFEFIFPLNGFFPSVTVIFLSLTDLLQNYNFALNLISTFAAVYVTFFFNYLFTKFLFPYLISKKVEQESFDSSSIHSIVSIFSFIPFILIALLILAWFPDFILDKYIVALIILLPKNLMEILEYDILNHKNYFYFYNSVGVDKTTILNKIIFKLIEPEYFLYQLKNHSLIWSIIIITEFIQQKEGVGGILRTVFKYQDISLIFTITILVSLLVFVIQKVLNLLYNKVYFWK